MNARLSDSVLARVLLRYPIGALLAVERNLVAASQRGRLLLAPDSSLPDAERQQLYQYAAMWMRLALGPFSPAPDGGYGAYARGWFGDPRSLVNPALKGATPAALGQPATMANLGGGVPLGPSIIALAGALSERNWYMAGAIAVLGFLIWRDAKKKGARTTYDVPTAPRPQYGWEVRRKKRPRPADWLVIE